MVIAEQTESGSYLLRGRRKTDRAKVPYWPTGSDALIKAGAHVKAHPDWLKECGQVGRELLVESV